MDSESRAYLSTILITIYKNLCFVCVKETFFWDVFLVHKT